VQVVVAPPSSKEEKPTESKDLKENKFLKELETLKENAKRLMYCEDPILRMYNNFQRLAKVLKENSRELTDKKPGQAHRDFKNAPEYQHLIRMAAHQYDNFCLEAVRLAERLIAAANQGIDKNHANGVDNFSKAIEALAAYIGDPREFTTLQNLITSTFDLDYTANTEKPGSVKGRVFGQFLMVVGAALATAAVIGITLSLLSAVGVGFAANAVQSIGAWAVGAPMSMLSVSENASFLGIESILTALLGVGIRELGRGVKEAYAPVGRQPKSSTVQNLEKLRNVVIPKPPRS
jgi:hypothetical protein